jgi:Zn-dependent protease
MPAPWGLTVDYERESVRFRLPDGLPVSTHYSFLLLALLITAPLWFQGRLASVVVAVLLMAILYLSILAHELGHVLAARAQSARTTGIEIHFLGGHAALEWDHGRGIALRPIAFAGPVINLVLAGLFYAVFWLVADQVSPDAAPFRHPEVLSRTLYLAALLNLGLGLVNLLPAFPLDGGVILQDTLSLRLGHRRATLVVALCGVVLACVSGLVAIVSFFAGIPLLLPLSFASNWAAVKENWRAREASQWRAQPLTSVVNLKEYRRKRP